MSLSPRAIVHTLLLGAMPVVLGACTLVGGMPPASGARPAAPSAPVTTERGPAASPAGAATTADDPAASRSASITAEVVDVARESLGVPYEWGGTDANGFDCSGLIQFAYAKLGIPLPRNSGAQMRSGVAVPAERAQLRPGDVLGFSSGAWGKTDHVGLYVGAGEFIHSSSSGVHVSTLHNPYWQRRLVAARRIVE